ncbi:hypothetical protein ENBRE01_0257 [Enteropsectra breve]|nr:hypothetical protein ENBRE01_0257 [Enteropsectra breve]
MEEEYFDLVVFGTTIRDIITEDYEDKKVIVVDDTKTYGSTYTSLQALSKSKYISGYRATKVPEELVPCLFEGLPGLLSSSSQIVQNHASRPFGGELDFLPIEKILFLDEDGQIYHVPFNKNEMAKCAFLSAREKYFISSAAKMKDFGVLRDALRDNKIESGFVRRFFFTEDLMPNGLLDYYFNYFESGPVVYPKYGFTEISENSSICCSLRGYSYLLCDNIKEEVVTQHNGQKENLYKLETDVGTIYTKKIKRQALRAQKSFIRLVLAKQLLLEDNFVMHISGISPVMVISLNTSTKVCPEGTQLLYFISGAGAIDNHVIESVLSLSNVLLDVEYEALFELNFNI